MRRLGAILAVLALLALAAAPLASAAEDPAGLLKQLVAAENKHDPSITLPMFNDDAVVKGPGDQGMYQTYTGIEEIKKFESNPDMTMAIEIDEPKVSGDTATANFMIHSADLKKANLDPGIGTVALTAKNGKIQMLDIKFDEAWAQKAMAAMTASATPGAAGTPAAMGAGATPEAMATGPGKLPATGDAPNPLPYALVLGGLLLAGGLMLRRFGRAA